MKWVVYFLVGGILFVQVVGCVTLRQLTHSLARVDNNAGTVPLPPYNGLKARIAIADFDVKVAKATGEIGAGLREMLIKALINSNRFQIVERQALNVITRIQELAVSSTAVKENSSARDQVKTADIIITAAVAEFEPQASGGAGGIGGGGGAGSGVLGGLLGSSLNKARLALDIRIIDTLTSKVLAAARVQGQAMDISDGFMGSFFGGWVLGEGLNAYANTPMEKAIRICVIEGARHISQAVPLSYYKY